MWQGESVSVILPIYNEKYSIAPCVRGFHTTGVVDEVLVLDHRAARGDSAGLRWQRAREGPAVAPAPSGVSPP
jgi:hypothetical protein